MLRTSSGISTNPQVNLMTCPWALMTFSEKITGQRASGSSFVQRSLNVIRASVAYVGVEVPDSPISVRTDYKLVKRYPSLLTSG